MRNIERIVVHCTATRPTATVGALLNHFRSLGWRHPGYHRVVRSDGSVATLLADAGVANGARGYNATSLHVAYIGGLDAGGRPADTRTAAQRTALADVLQTWKNRYPRARIVGHRDLSPDTNGNGRVDAWERIKECPCFEAAREYANISAHATH